MNLPFIPRSGTVLVVGLVLLLGTSNCLAQVGDLRLRSDTQTLFAQALADRREGRLPEALQAFEAAIRADPRVLQRNDEGLAMALLADYTRKTEQNPLSLELYQHLLELEGIIAKSREEGLKRIRHVLGTTAAPQARASAQADWQRLDREFRTILAVQAKRENPWAKNRLIPPPRAILPLEPPPENAFRQNAQNDDLERELRQLKDRLVSLQREKLVAEQAFYDSFRRSSRSQAPGRPGHHPSDPAVNYHLQNQTRQSHTDVFGLRQEITTVQQRIDSIERELGIR